MRRRHIKINKILSGVINSCALFLLVSYSAFAKKNSKDVDIVCFATPKKWVCAPESEQNIANEKAANLIKKYNEETPDNIIIKSIDIPKFTTEEPIQRNSDKSFVSMLAPRKEEVKEEQEKELIKQEVQPAENINPSTDVTVNPYAKLWSHQLIGVSTPENAVKFVKQKGLSKEDILIIKSVYKGHDWWIVLYGLYQDKKTGKESEHSIPETIEKYWLRPLKNLDVRGFIEDF